MLFRSVTALLAERGIPLEVCPTSNYLTGAARRRHPHPLHELDARGVLLTIDADDPTLFGASITDEYLYVAQHAGVPFLERCIMNAANAAFLDSGLKQALRARVGTELLAGNAN